MATVLSQWYFNENTGTSVEDSGTGTDLDLTITPGTGWTGSAPHIGYDGGGSSFIRSSTWASGSGNKYFDNLNGTKACTMTIVIQFASNPTSQERVLCGISDTDGSRWYVMWINTDGTVYVEGATLGMTNMNATGALSTGSRHVISFVFDSVQATAANRGIIYVDGSVAASNPASDAILQNAVIDINHFSFSNLFVVGCRGDNNSGRRFDGHVYYCDIITDALTSGQITALHSALATSDDANPYGGGGTTFSVEVGDRTVTFLD